MCGEHAAHASVMDVSEGSSPHVRGARLAGQLHALRHGIIPACAGSTTSRSTVPMYLGDHPRMCGEHLYVREESVWKAGSSPHVRGAPGAQGAQAVELGIIPACAGSTPPRSS